MPIDAGALPRTVEALSAYDVVILSDIGANSFVLPPEVFLDGRRADNPLLALAEWTLGGGALMMAGVSQLHGFQARANFARTAVAEVLPVTMLASDDRVEAPQGVSVAVTEPTHPGRRLGRAGRFRSDPARLQPGPPGEEATVAAIVGGDVLAPPGRWGGAGRWCTSDIGPHWCPEDFLAWDGFAPLVGGRWLDAR